MTTNQLQEILDDIQEMKADKVGTSQILAYVQRVIQKAVNRKKPKTAQEPVADNNK